MNFLRSITFLYVLVISVFVYCLPAGAVSIDFNLYGYTDNAQTTRALTAKVADCIRSHIPTAMLRASVR